jgi:2-keto-4-pentenoate hydratase
MPLEEAANRLRNAYVSGPVPPLRNFLEPTDAASAYRIQSINTEFWRTNGRRMVGRKIGLTATAVQAQAEVALVLARDLSNPKATPEEVAAASDYAVTAIEIVDSRIADWKISFADTVADNGSAAFFVLGSERKLLAGLDLYTCGMVLEVNATVASLGAAQPVSGIPSMPPLGSSARSPPWMSHSRRGTSSSPERSVPWWL